MIFDDHCVVLDGAECAVAFAISEEVNSPERARRSCCWHELAAGRELVEAPLRPSAPKVRVDAEQESREV